MQKKDERKGERIVILCEPSFLARVQKAAERNFRGNRSDLAREAIVEYIERIDAEVSGTSQEATAA